MGQKISPVALRLQTNKTFQASWYSQKFYAHFLQKQLQLQTFLNQVFAQVGTKAIKTHCVQNPGALDIQTFFCSPRVFDERFLKKSISLKPTSFFQQHTTKQWQFLPNQLQWNTLKKKIVFQNLLTNMASQQRQTIFTRKYIFEEPYKDTAQLKFYVHHIEGLSQQYFNTSSKWDPFKVNEYTKSAQFTAEYLANALELQKPVKQIFSTVQAMLKKDKNVEGFKIACSGRLQGVEMAKTETLKFGKISLHVFSSKVDYAEARASTGFGILGVKVWICYKD